MYGVVAMAYGNAKQRVLHSMMYCSVAILPCQAHPQTLALPLRGCLARCLRPCCIPTCLYCLFKPVPRCILPCFMLQVRLEERELHARLSQYQKELSQPDNFQGKLYELNPHVASRLNNPPALTRPVMDQAAMQSITTYLGEQKEKLKIVCDVLKKDMRDMEIIQEKCNEKCSRPSMYPSRMGAGVRSGYT